MNFQEIEENQVLGGQDGCQGNYVMISDENPG